MSKNRVVPDSWEDSVFDSSGESRHREGGRPSGTSTQTSQMGQTVTARISPIRQLKRYKTTPSVKRKNRNTSTQTPSPATSKHVKRGARGRMGDVVSIVSESSGEGEGLSPTQQQSLRTNQ